MSVQPCETVSQGDSDGHNGFSMSESNSAGSFRFSADKFLHEDAVRRNLVLSALYLFAFEVLKTAIITDVKDFLVFDETDGREIEEYESRLQNLARNKWRASCLFLEEIGVLSSQDLLDVRAITSHRNSIAHELPRLLVSEDLDVDIEQLGRIRQILGQVDNWRKEYDVLPIYPGVKAEDVRSMRTAIVDKILWDVVSMIEGDAKYSDA